jgi:hypothetical protein
MTVIRLPADPALAAILAAALPNSNVALIPGATTTLVDQAIRHGLACDPVAIADAIDALVWTKGVLTEVTVPRSFDGDLRSLFHRISLALPMGRRAPRLDDDAIVAGCLVVFSGHQRDTLMLQKPSLRNAVVPPKPR